MNTKPPAYRLDKLQPIALRLTAAEKRQAKKLALDDARSTASFARQMYLRGLALYLDEQRKVA